MANERLSIFDAGGYEPKVARAAELLKGGGVVVLPTETVYGAAARLDDATGLSRLKSLRHGGDPMPFTVHLAHRDDARNYIGPTGDFAARMMKKLWPGPVALTLDVPADRRAEVAARLRVDEKEIYDGGAITLRCPDHLVAADVIGAVDGPVGLVAVGNTPESASDLPAEAFDLLLDAGPARYAKPSTILKITGDGYKIVREGVYDERIIERLLKTTVLFVCSGNTCRSPMAEALGRKALAEKLGIPEAQLDSKGYTVLSAGSFAMPGARATPQAVEAVRSMGADLTKHRSRPLSVELIHQADVIFTMGRSHMAAVGSLVPSALEKTFGLDPDRDVEDPIGGDLSLYQDLAKQLQGMIEKRLAEKLS
jgi:protein-tyrosine phosphatase